MSEVERLACLSLLGLIVMAGCDAATPDAASAIQDDRLQVAEITERERSEYQEALPGLLASPCDELVAPSGNEMHDCQRLVMVGQGGPEFGSLIGIFPEIMSIQLPADAYRQPRLVAYITNAGGALEPDDQYNDYGYPPLGIRPRPEVSRLPSTYCLWLRRAADWEAALLADRGGAGRTCLFEPDEGAWDALEVIRQTYGDASLRTYPNTARWQWTTPASHGGEHYIGVKCGAGWCAVGRRGFSPVPIPRPMVQPNPRAAIPGFHDSQFLAVGARGALRPGPWGEALPLFPYVPPGSPPPPGRQNAVSFLLKGAVDEYVDKLRLINVGPDTWQSWVEIETPPLNQPQAWYRNIDGAIQQASGVTPGADGHGPHLAARWRWQPDDESVWIPCVRYGCCDIDDAL